MAAPEVAVAYVSIVPSLRGFQRTLRDQIVTPSRRVGEDAGRQTGVGFNRGLQRMSSAVQHTFTDFTAGFRSAEAAASRFTGRMGTLGGASRRALNPAIQQVNQFSAGFRDAQVAASRFSGVMGTLGGATRRAVTPAVSAVGRFAGGFRDAQVAASAFSGRLGTLGGVTRRVMTPLITGTRAVGGALQSAGRVAGSALGAVGRGFQSAGRAAANVGGSIRSSLSGALATARENVGSLGGAFTRMGGMAAGALAGIGIAQLGRSALTAAADIQQTSASMAGLYGNTRDAEDMMRRLRDYSRDKPLETQSLYEAGQNLAYLGLKGNDAIKVVQNVGTALMASGNTSKDAMSQVSSALLSMQSAGQLYAADIQKVSDQMVPAWDLLAAHMGKSIKEVRDEVTAGNLTVDDFVEALQAGDGDYFAMMRKSADKTSQTFKAQFATVKDNLITTLGETLLPLVDKAAPAMGRLGERMNEGLKGIPDLLARLRKTLVDAGVPDAFQRLADGARAFGRAAEPVFKGFGDVVGAAFITLLKSAGPVGDALKSIGTWMGNNAGLVKVFGAALGGAAVAMGGLRIATLGWAVATKILGLAVVNTPIGWLITAIAALAAGFIYAWKNSETFRNIFIGVWDGIKTAVSATWNGALKPIIDGIVTGWNWVVDASKAVGGALSTAWSAVGTAFRAVGSAITTAFDAVGSAATWLWGTVLKPVFGFINRVLRDVATAVTMFLVTPFVLGYLAVSEAVKFLWSKAIKPYFNLIWSYVKFVGSVFLWLYNNAVKPAFAYIAERATWLWQSGVKPAFDAFVGGLKLLAKWARWLYDSGIKPAFQLIVDRAKWLWSSGIKPSANAVVGAFQTLAKWARWLYDSGIKPAFQWIVNRAKWLYSSGIKPVGAAIRQAFSLMSSAVKKLYTGGIKPAFGWISDRAHWVWSKGVKPPFDAMKKGVGKVASSFGTAKDNIKTAWDKLKDIAKKPVSFLINTVYNKGIVALWNKIAGAFGADKLGEFHPKGFASGGILPGYTPGRDVHLAALSGGEAVMRPEFTRGAGAGFVNTMNSIARSKGVSGVREAMASMGGQLPAFKNGGIFGWIKKAGSAVKGAGSSAWDGVKKAAGWLKDSILGSVKAGAKALVNPLIDRIPGGGQLKGLVKAIPRKALESIFSYSKKADDKGGAGGSLKNPGGSGVTRWKPYVIKALAANGLSTSPAMVARVLRQIATESGGNPRAVQGIVDINSRTGNLARGLMQTIPPTFNAHKFPGHGNIFNGYDNLLAALHYAKARYGPSLSFLGNGHGYDSGGWLMPGDTRAVNKTGKPEPILNPGQWKSVATLANRGMESGGLQPGDRLVLTLDGKTELEAYVDRRADQRIKRGLVTPATRGRSL